MRSVQTMMLLLVFAACLNSHGQQVILDRETHANTFGDREGRRIRTKLASASERYVIRGSSLNRYAQTSCRKYYFWGGRKLNPKYAHTDSAYRIYEFDTETLDCSPVLSEETYKRHFAREVEVHQMLLGPRSKLLAVGRVSENVAAGLATCDLVLIDLDSRSVRVLVADGQFNQGFAFSGDGKHIAYYSNSPESYYSSTKPVKVGSLRVINVATKEVVVLTDHFLETGMVLFETGSPIWVDADRLLFGRSVDKEHGPGSVLSTLIYYPSTGQTQSLSLNGNPWAGHVVLVDKGNARLIIASDDKIVQTDFDLQNPIVLAESDTITKKFCHLCVENGELKYAYRENKELKYSKKWNYVYREGNVFRLRPETD